MISLSIYGYKKYKKAQKKKEEKRAREAGGELPPVVDQSAEIVQSPTSSLPSRPVERGAVNYAESTISHFSGTASEPSSALEPNSAVSGGWPDPVRSSTLNSTSSEHQAYQQYIEGQSKSLSKDISDQPPTYQVALSPPSEQPRGQWIFIPAGGPVPFGQGPPANPLSPSPLSASALPASPPFANELPASLPTAAYKKSTINELPADIPVVPAKAGETPRFELATQDALPPSRKPKQSDSDEESRKSGDMKRYELA
jgi:hypothetical protein